MITYKKNQFAMKTGDNTRRWVGFLACPYKEIPITSLCSVGLQSTIGMRLFIRAARKPTLRF